MNCISSGKSLLSGICHFPRACREKSWKHREEEEAGGVWLWQRMEFCGGDKLQLLSIPMKILPLTCRAGSFFQLSYPATKTGTFGSKPVTYRLRLLQANTETLLETQKAFCTRSLLFTHEDPGVKLHSCSEVGNAPQLSLILRVALSEAALKQPRKFLPKQNKDCFKGNHEINLF